MNDPWGLAAGSVFGGYRIEGELGRGGMGVVYRAVQLGLERPVALKLIAPDAASDSVFRRRFEREARLAASLDDPHVLPVYEAGEHGGRLYLSMRLVEGMDLEALVRAEGHLEPRRACALVAQVASALDAAHARGLVHRDVKPRNVLVERRQDGEHAFLADFGLAKADSVVSAATTTETLTGTVDYISPEQIRGEPLDGRIDVYALGCLLYECVEGRVPFARSSLLAKLWAHMHDEPPRLTGRGLANLDPVVRRAMAKQPERRYQTAGELGRAAMAAVEGGDAPTAFAFLHRRRPSRLRLALGIVAVVGLAGASSLVFVVTRASPSPPSSKPHASSARNRRTAVVVSTGSGFSPAARFADQGAAVKWVFRGPGTHGVRDSSGMDLFDSGPRPPSSAFSFRFTAAGHYSYVDTAQPRSTGIIRVALAAQPSRGTRSTRFSIVWASAPLRPGYVEDLRVRRPGRAWVNWLTGQTRTSATFVPDAGSGAYTFRARLRKLAGGAHTSYAAKTITVGR